MLYAVASKSTKNEEPLVKKKIKMGGVLGNKSKGK